MGGPAACCLHPRPTQPSILSAMQGRIKDLGKDFFSGSERTEAPRRVHQQLVIFCKLYYNNVLCKEAKQFILVNLAL